jgi:hypothetical protein
MARLDLPIPSFILRRRLVIQTETTGDKRHNLVVKGIDVDGTPATFLQSVKLDYNRRTVRSEPFIINLRSNPEAGTELKLELEFMGHYGEPNLEVAYISQGDDDTETHFLLEYKPGDGSWKTTRLENPALEDAARRTTSGKRMVVDLTGDDWIDQLAMPDERKKEGEEKEKEKEKDTLCHLVIIKNTSLLL